MATLTIVKLSDHGAPIFLADTDGKERFEFYPDQRLVWRFRVKDRDKEFREIPQDGLIEMDENLRIVRIVPARLGGDGHQIELQVATTGEQRMTSDSFTFTPTELAEPRPFRPFITDEDQRERLAPPSNVEVTMSRARVPPTKDEVLASVIRASTNALAVNDYIDFMNQVFVNTRLTRKVSVEEASIARMLDIPVEPFVLASSDAFRVLSLATELFVLSRCGVIDTKAPLRLSAAEEEARFGHQLPKTLTEMWKEYLEPLPGGDGALEVLPYLSLIRRKLGDATTLRSSHAGLIDRQATLVEEKLLNLPMLELIWSYWIEESMAVQAFNSIMRRFQNLRVPGERDPLAALELDPLRPVSHLLWAWTQDEQSRLSVLRRAHEYHHEYGFSLHGKAVADLQAADRRSKFLESFHNLLWRASQFYTLDDNTTVHADAFALLNAIKETHYLLSQGAHNQFPNVATTARIEMLTQLWILSRPEMREFLGSRLMVPYPEPWMDRVDTVKTLKGWTDTSVVHFRDLAVFGEQILLSIRYGAWSLVNDANSAANWARYWRAEVQGYIHGYRAATGVDLSVDVTDQRQAESRFVPPSVHLRNRLLQQSAR